MHQIKKIFCRKFVFYSFPRNTSLLVLFFSILVRIQNSYRESSKYERNASKHVSFCMIKRPRLSETKRKETHFKEMNSMCTKSLLGSGNVSWICSEELCLLMPLILQRNFLGQSQVRKCSSNQRFGERPCFHHQEADDMGNADLSYVYRVFLKWVQAYYT